MSSGRLLGVDFGTVRVGLAITDPDRQIAFPLTTLSRRGPDSDAAFFRALAAEHGISCLVVGLPVHLNGREGQKAVEARDYGQWLGKVTGLPVVFFDERFTTTQAEAALWQAGLTHQRRKDRRDRVAAQIMLQSYLDAGCPPEPTALPLDEPLEQDE